MRWSRRAILTGVALLACAGCGGGGGSGGGAAGGGAPTITVLVQNTDCAIKDITITPFTVEQSNSGGALSLRIKANVKCMGQPLSGATLTFTLPGTTTPTTATSDANGDASTTPNNPDNKDAVGKTVGVSVTGEDGMSYPQGSATVTAAP